MSDRKPQTRQNLPRGSSTGKSPSNEELLVKKAAGMVGFDPEELMAWKIYPDRVVLIAVDGRKQVIELNEMQ